MRGHGANVKFFAVGITVSAMADPLLTVLKPALEAARRALADLDADQVPADLRKVVAVRGGRLPPPLALSLLDGLERYEWLRDQALEAWPEADPSVEGPPGVAAVYLARDEGWGLRVAREVESRVRTDAAAATAQAEREASRAREEAGAVRARLRSDRQAHAEEAARLRTERDRARAERNELAAVERREAGVAGRSIAAAEERMAALGQRLGEVQAERDRARDELRDERKARTAAEHLLAEKAGGSRWWAADPVDMAQRLDDLSVMFRPVARSRPQAPGESEDLSLPRGVSPDSAAAVDWLVARTSPTTVLVDGYNVGFRMMPGGDPAAARDRVRPLLERLARVARGPMRVIVVFDGVTEPAATPWAGGPVEERFTAGGTADDEIASLAAGEVAVVVSDDRAVRDAVEDAGGRGLWSAALVAWAAARR